MSDERILSVEERLQLIESSPDDEIAFTSRAAKEIMMLASYQIEFNVYMAQALISLLDDDTVGARQHLVDALTAGQGASTTTRAFIERYAARLDSSHDE